MVTKKLSGAPLLEVSYARHFDAQTAADQCAAQLLGASPAMLLVFCGGKHDPNTMLAALRQHFGPIPIVGGSAAGAISRTGFGYSGLELVVLAFTDVRITPELLVTGDLLEGEIEAGRALGRDVAAAASPEAVVLLFFDSVAVGAPLRLHYASAIVDGFYAGLDGKQVTLIGGGLLTDMNLSDAWVFDGSRVRKHAAIALVFPKRVRAETVVLHGCRPVSTFMQITRIDGAEVFELDGQPALAVIEQMLGMSLGSAGGQSLSLIATLGEKQGDQFAPYDENAYVNRLILTANQARGSITLFEPDFHPGAMVQIMSRDNSLMLRSVEEGIAASNARLAETGGFLNLYIDCAGRASGRSGAAMEEADLVRQGTEAAVPLLGFYSGVEIAPFAGYSRPLDWTGVLTTLRLEE